MKEDWSMPKTKVFNHKRYQKDQSFFTKKGALKRVKELRKKGYFARAIKSGSVGLSAYAYTVYCRERE